ncbi:MAG: hypothetical protein U0169_07105 [Polyangiaceae bacterium]
MGRYRTSDLSAVWVKTQSVPVGSPQLTWSKVVADASGGVAVMGTMNAGALDFGGGARTAPNFGTTVVVRYSSTGAYLWDTTFDAKNFTLASAMAFDAANDLYVAQTFSNQLFVGTTRYLATTRSILFAKYAGATGAVLSAKKLGDAGMFAVQALDVGSDGDVFLQGTFSGLAGIGDVPLPRTSGDTPWFFARLSPAGILRSVKTSTANLPHAYTFDRGRSRFQFTYAGIATNVAGNWGNGIAPNGGSALVAVTVP